MDHIYFTSVILVY